MGIGTLFLVVLGGIVTIKSSLWLWEASAWARMGLKQKGASATLQANMATGDDSMRGMKMRQRQAMRGGKAMWGRRATRQ